MIVASAGDAFGQAIISGSLLLAIPVAVLAGLVSFASPCVLPLVPAYLGYLGGMTGAAGRAADRSARPSPKPQRSRLLLGVSLFIAGFTVVYLVLGVLAGSLGGVLLEYQDTIMRVLGVVVIVMGLAFLGFIPFLQNERRAAPRPARRPVGRAAAGHHVRPRLGAVHRPDARRDHRPVARRRDRGPRRAARGRVLPRARPAVPAGRVQRRAQRASALAFLRRHRLAIMRLGGGMLIVLGLALVTGVWGQWAGWLQGVVSGNDAVRAGGVT